jgi:hypothetical protein
MRLLILSLVLANAALMSVADPASAQSPTSYPWCSRSGDRDNYNNCYFTSKEQCLKTQAGIGAFCFENPYYHPSPSSRARTRQSTRQ